MSYFFSASVCTLYRKIIFVTKVPDEIQNNFSKTSISQNYSRPTYLIKYVGWVVDRWMNEWLEILRTFKRSFYRMRVMGRCAQWTLFTVGRMFASSIFWNRDSLISRPTLEILKLRDSWVVYGFKYLWSCEGSYFYCFMYWKNPPPRPQPLKYRCALYAYCIYVSLRLSFLCHYSIP